MNTAPAPEETILVQARRFACDGNGGNGVGALGHPRVYLTLAADDATECPYCGRHFVLDHSDTAGNHH